MQSIVQTFDAALKVATDASKNAHSLDASGYYILPLGERELITQAAFVRMFVALEEFLEEAFGHYGMAGTSLNGNSFQCYSNAPTGDHFHNMLIGLNRFVDWSAPERVRKLAELYFPNGEPFATPLQSAHGELLDMKTVRNAASHVSRTTSAQVTALYLRWTGQPSVSATAYEMLTSPGGQNQQTFMSHAEKVLRATAQSIANG
ncbi:hypothetical protein [Nocardioides campestrisoli]|uniref:hypothetical protein n=1 Tax=Nocardioides campestrisoli TaxID=2736757 RepID=UPI0015E665B4|nr:hypothetical protein [Nocardioides campestrisoli]